MSSIDAVTITALFINNWDQELIYIIIYNIILIYYLFIFIFRSILFIYLSFIVPISITSIIIMIIMIIVSIVTITIVFTYFMSFVRHTLFFLNNLYSYSLLLYNHAINFLFSILSIIFIEIFHRCFLLLLIKNTYIRSTCFIPLYSTYFNFAKFFTYFLSIYI